MQQGVLEGVCCMSPSTAHLLKVTVGKIPSTREVPGHATNTNPYATSDLCIGLSNPDLCLVSQTRQAGWHLQHNRNKQAWAQSVTIFQTIQVFKEKSKRWKYFSSKVVKCKVKILMHTFNKNIKVYVSCKIQYRTRSFTMLYSAQRKLLKLISFWSIYTIWLYSIFLYSQQVLFLGCSYLSTFN